jgi:hypothetical protein
MKRCYSIIGILFSLFVLCLPAAWAQDGLDGALSRSGASPRPSLGSGEQLVAADFDSDDRPDAAILLKHGLSNGKTCFYIELHVTAGTNHGITFSSTESSLTISAIDVNRDGAPDIVIEKEFTHERLQIFLNDGHGDFHKVRSEDDSLPDPSAPQCRPPWPTQRMSLSCLPPTRGRELREWRCVATVVSARAGLLNSRGDVSRSQLGAQFPSNPRAPPLSFVL